MKSDKDKYLKMQHDYYEEYASQWSLEFRDPVVGSYDAHNAWSDYDTKLFKDFDTSELVALEYGCGPGRNLVKFAPRFKRVDGIDISQINLAKAHVNLEHNKIKGANLFLTSGDNLSDVESNSYDVVFSVICLQHICVHDIRFSIMSDIYRVLKPGGKFCFQMGFGGKEGIPTANYFDNNYDAMSTNGHADISIENEADLIDDLINNIGFRNYKSDIAQTGPGDNHRNWIWVEVEK